MSETDETLAFYKGQLRALVWSGFFNEDDFQLQLEDLSYDEQAAPHLDTLRQYGEALMEEKREADSGWPVRTDWDRLAQAFEALERDAILATHNSGYTTSDAHHDAWEIIRGDPAGQWRGFAYYHEQDVERTVDGMPLLLGFDAVADGEDAKRAVGEAVAAGLRDAGFTVDWNGDPETRMGVTDIDWKKRTNWASRRTTPADKGGGFLRRLFGR